MRTSSYSRDLTRGIWEENPVFVQLLGLCPALAVTNTVMNGIAMGLATMFVLVSSAVLVSLFRKLIPYAVRITTYVLIVGTFVTIVDIFMQATVPAVSKALGAFVYLIVVNCMILGRIESFASKQPVGRSLLDAAGTSLGFLLALVLMGALREVLGLGTFLGYDLFGPGFQPWLVMALPPGGFLAIGGILLGLNWWKLRRREGSRARSRPHPVTRVVNVPSRGEAA
jgi:electron transport complex protein RnfE